MFKPITSLVLVALLGLGTAACTTQSDNRTAGNAETTGAKAGRAIDDSVITGKVKAALIADPTTKASQIEVETFKGTVQLSGFVDSAESRTRAIEVARNVEGVKNVKNAMELRNNAG
jgi:osmotically-inducible protein OsmY